MNENEEKNRGWSLMEAEWIGARRDGEERGERGTGERDREREGGVG